MFVRAHVSSACILLSLILSVTLAPLDATAQRANLKAPVHGQVLDYERGAQWTFSWSPVQGAVDYQLSVTDNNIDLVDTYVGNATTHTVTITSLVPKSQLRSKQHEIGTLYVAGWYVRPVMADGSKGSWSSPNTLWLRYNDTRPEPTPIARPALVGPGNGVNLPNATVDGQEVPRWAFDWAPVSRATWYELEVYHPADPSLRASFNTQQTEFSHPVIADLTDERHIIDQRRTGWRWRVRASESGQAWSGWSEERSFSVQRARQPERPTPPAPTLASPQSGVQMPNADAQGRLQWRFRWQPVADAQQYQLRVQRRGSPNAMFNSKITTTYYDINRSGNFTSGNLSGWTWAVRAYANGQWGPWATRSFSVAPQRQQQRPQESVRIVFRNNGGYVAKYQIIYVLNGQKREWNSGNMTVGQYKDVELPAGATAIVSGGWAKTLTSWTSIFSQRTTNTRTPYCFSTTGTVFSPKKSNC